MGILNVTPDSFSDTGKFLNPEDAIKQVKQMVADGADIIDIGGESTRPGSEAVSTEEEINRIIPVVKKIIKEINVPISIDTYKYEVAKESLKYGVHIINDITGLHNAPNIARLIAEHNAGVVIMHIKGTPKNMQVNPTYNNVVDEILNYIEDGVKLALGNGVDKDSIVIDPGIGFGKTLEHNLEIISKLFKFRVLGFPVLIGNSRKSFIGKILNAEVHERLEGTLAVNTISILNGASILRVHDVKENKRIAMLTDSILKYTSNV